MGFVRERRTYRLVFEDPEYEGLEVVARSASVADYQDIAALANRPYANPPSDDDLAEIDKLFVRFASVLVSWNLEEPAGKRVPATVKGLKSQDLPFAMDIILAWMEAVVGVPRPLPQPSADGGTSLEASLPMEVLSPSL